MNKMLAITLHSVLFLLFFLLFAYGYEELGLVGYFGYSDIFIFLIAPNVLYIALYFLIKSVRKYLKQILIIGNSLTIFTFIIGILIWFAGWS
jgi:hypothetical protein